MTLLHALQCRGMLDLDWHRSQRAWTPRASGWKHSLCDNGQFCTETIFYELWFLGITQKQILLNFENLCFCVQFQEWSSGNGTWLMIQRLRQWILATVDVLQWKQNAEARVCCAMSVHVREPQEVEITASLIIIMDLGRKTPEITYYYNFKKCKKRWLAARGGRHTDKVSIHSATVSCVFSLFLPLDFASVWYLLENAIRVNEVSLWKTFYYTTSLA